ncbi:MAG: glycosyltransferase, partial [Thiotrichaceae bacterium]
MKKIESGNVNIVIVITKGDIGGAQIHVKDIAVALQALGNTVTVVVGEDAEFTEMLRGLNIPYRVLNHLAREINSVKDFKAYKEIRQLISDIKPDLVTLHSSKAGILGRIAVYLDKVPSTFTVHGWAFTDGVSSKKQLIYKTIEKIGALFPTHLIAVSKFDRKIGIEKGVCKSQKIKAIQNGMPDIDQSLMADASKTPPKLIMVARFAQQKDHKTLIEALSELKDLPWELNLIGGDGGLLAESEAAIERYGLQDKIHILGYRNDIDQLMAQ